MKGKRQQLNLLMYSKAVQVRKRIGGSYSAHLCSLQFHANTHGPHTKTMYKYVNEEWKNAAVKAEMRKNAVKWKLYIL